MSLPLRGLSFQLLWSMVVLLDVPGGSVSVRERRLRDDRVHRVPVQLPGARTCDHRPL